MMNGYNANENAYGVGQNGQHPVPINPTYPGGGGGQHQQGQAPVRQAVR